MMRPTSFPTKKEVHLPMTTNAAPTATQPLRSEITYRAEREHLSAKGFGTGNLPWFTVIAGPNGAGKTHFLQAIDNGSIRILIDGELVAIDAIRLLDWTTMEPGAQGAAAPSQVLQMAEQPLHHFRSQMEGGTARQRINAFLASHPPLTESQILSPNFSQESSDTALIVEVERFQQEVVASILDNSGSYRHLLEGVIRASPESILTLSARDFRRLVQVQLGNDDPLRQSLSQTFLAYRSLLDENDLARYRARDGVEQQSFLETEEFHAQYGMPPWQVLDGLLADRGLAFHVTAPKTGSEFFTIELISDVSGAEIPFSDLSSGERILVGLIVAVYGATRGTKSQVDLPRVLLLDEIDAPLHPEMTRTMLELLDATFINNNCATILTTHSISTIALAPVDSVFYLTAEQPRLEGLHPGVAISRLSAGLTALPYDNAERIICAAESPIDADLYTRVAAAVGPFTDKASSLVFLPARADRGEGGRSVVSRAVRDHRDEGRLNNYFGIVDRDEGDPASISPPLFTLGSRYSLENYLCDPLMIAALMVREKHLHNPRYAELVSAIQMDRHPGTWGALKVLQNDELQGVVDAVLALVESQGNGEPVDCHLLGGRVVNFPQWLLNIRGHDLVRVMLQAFPELNAYTRREYGLMTVVAQRVIPDVPELASMDFATLFGTISDEFARR